MRLCSAGRPKKRSALAPSTSQRRRLTRVTACPIQRPVRLPGLCDCLLDCDTRAVGGARRAQGAGSPPASAAGDTIFPHDGAPGKWMGRSTEREIAEIAAYPVFPTALKNLPDIF